MLDNIMGWLHRLTCPHPSSCMIKRTSESRLWLECMLCSYTTNGIELVKKYTATYPGVTT